MRRGRKVKLVGALVIVLALCVACDPGFVNPSVGTGDVSGTVPGTTWVPEDQVELGEPKTVVDLGEAGFLVYDQATCQIYLTRDGQTTLYAGNGTCANTDNGSPATQAAIMVGLPPLRMGMVADPEGNVYLGTTDGHVRRIDADTGIITGVPVVVGPDERIIGASGEAGGQFTYVVWEDGFVRTSVVRRIDAAGNDTVLYTLAGPIELGVAGFVRMGPDHYVAFGGLSSETDWGLVDLDHGQVTLIPLPTSLVVILDAADDQGNIYGEVFSERGTTNLVRINPDHTVDIIAGNGVKDPATIRQHGAALDLAIEPFGVAVTRHGHLLFTSGHVVYHLNDPANAPAAGV